MPMPTTVNDLPALACVSAMQKCIRRGMESDAMQFAVELMHSSKAFHTMVCNRLEIISHEDIDTAAAPWIVPFVKAACDQSRAWYDPKKFGKARMPLGNAIRMMCRAAKSREGDHFQAAIGLASLLEGFKPEIPDWAFDAHTAEGRRRGRGLEFFRKESVKLSPPPKQRDQYEAEAFRLWAVRDAKPQADLL